MLLEHLLREIFAELVERCCRHRFAHARQLIDVVEAVTPSEYLEGSQYLASCVGGAGARAAAGRGGRRGPGCISVN